MVAPNFYNEEDQEIYQGGDHFITQAPYRGNYQNIFQTGAVSQTPGVSGITNTQIAKPFILPPDGSGGDFKGGGKYSNLDMSKTKTFMKNVYVDQGPKKGWQKQAVTGYYDTNTGGWKTAENRNINHAGIEVPGLFTSLMNKVSGKQFGEPQVGDIQGTFTKDPSGDIEEEEAVYKAALHRNRINKIISTGIYNKDYKPQGGGGVDVKDIPADITYTDRGTFTDDHPDTPTKTPAEGGWHPGVKDGGRIGYRNGEFVEDINVEGPGFDENLMASDDNNTRLLENLFEKYLELGFSPEDAEIKAMEEFELMSQGPEQDQGIASLV